LGGKKNSELQSGPKKGDKDKRGQDSRLEKRFRSVSQTARASVKGQDPDWVEVVFVNVEKKEKRRAKGYNCIDGVRWVSGRTKKIEKFLSGEGMKELQKLTVRSKRKKRIAQEGRNQPGKRKKRLTYVHGIVCRSKKRGEKSREIVEGKGSTRGGKKCYEQ